MSDTVSLSEILNKFRKLLEEDQSEVAEKLDLPAASLSFYERGERTPPYEVLIKLLEYYDARLTIESQLGKWVCKEGEDELELEEVPKSEELDLLTGLDEQEREDLVAYIRRRKHHET